MTDFNPWIPITIRKINSKEKYFYPLYNLILTLAFPPQENFIVAPQTYPSDSRDSIDFSLEYDLYRDDKLICFLEIKPEDHINDVSKRNAADIQMRRRFVQLAQSFQIEKLIGISAIGRKCAIYHMKLGSSDVYPLEIIPINTSITEDLAPVTRWSIDINTENGRTELSLLFEEMRLLARC